MKLCTDGAIVTGQTNSYRFSWQIGGAITISRGAEARQYSLKGEASRLQGTPECALLDVVEWKDTFVASLVKRNENLFVTTGEREKELIIGTEELLLDDASTTQILWPMGLIWSKGVTVSDLCNERGGLGTVREDPHISLSINHWGVGVASNASGNAFLFKHGDLRPSIAVKLPTQPEARLFAELCSSGALVTIVIDERDSAVLAVADDGRVIQALKGYGMSPARLVGDTVIVCDDGGHKLLSLDTNLRVIDQATLSFSAKGIAVAPDERSFALADECYVLSGRIDENGRIVIEHEASHYEVDRQERRRKEVAEMAARYEPRRYHGEAAIGFGTERVNPRWMGKAGEEFSLDLMVRSTGGEGGGLVVTVSGKALEHVEFIKGVVEGSEASFISAPDGKTARIEFPSMPIPAGIVYPLEPVPSNDDQNVKAAELLAITQFKIVLKGQARMPSREILAVSVSARNSACPPMKLMAPLVISDG